MCGRITLKVDPEEIARWLRVDPGLFQTRYNIAPTQWVPVVRVARAGAPREAASMRWGLVPAWAQELSIGNKMINARAEGVFEKPAFRNAIKCRRCLVPVSGFYEWVAAATLRDKRKPYLIRMKNDKPFALGGLWETNALVPEGPLDTFSILTTAANALMRPIHDRMPVIIPESQYDRWLNPDAADIRNLLSPYAPDDLYLTPVSDYVSHASHEGPECYSPPGARTEESALKTPLKKRGKTGERPGQKTLFD